MIGVLVVEWLGMMILVMGRGHFYVFNYVVYSGLEWAELRCCLHLWFGSGPCLGGFSLSLSLCVCVVYVDIRFRYRVEEYRLMTEVYSNMIGIKCVHVYLCSRLESVKLDKYSFQLLKLLKR